MSKEYEVCRSCGERFIKKGQTQTFIISVSISSVSRRMGVKSVESVKNVKREEALERKYCLRCEGRLSRLRWLGCLNETA